jgi:phage shock protein E
MVNKIVGVVVLVGTLMMSSCASNSSSNRLNNDKIEEITTSLENVNEINFKNKKNVLLDVRTPEEFAEGHVPGAINIDVKNENFSDKISKLDANKNYYIYCRTGVRAKLATEKMQEKGLNNVVSFKDGMYTYKGTVEK